MKPTRRIHVDVRVGDDLAHLYLTASTQSSQLEVFSIVRQYLDPKSALRTVNGIRIAAKDLNVLGDAGSLLTVHADDFVKRVVKNRCRLDDAYEQQLAMVRQIRTGGADANRLISDCEGLSTLDPHQVRNVAAMSLPGGFGLCLFDEQGAGKTVSLIYCFDLLVQRDEIDFALIVAPKSMVSEWPGDFDRFKAGMHRVIQLTGSSLGKRAAIGRDSDVLVTNFETIITHEEHFRALLKSFNGRCMLAIDESFFIKSPDAKRTRALRRLREWCDRAYVLCGTPAPNAPQDVVEQFNLVDFGRTFRGVEIPNDRVAALPIVQSVLEGRGLYLRNLKVDVLPDLPGKTFRKVLLEMEPAQAAIYQDALNNYIRVLEETSDDQFKREFVNFLAKRSALLQICSDPGLVAPQYQGVPAKIACLDRLLASLILDQGEKVILWSFYTETISKMYERYSKYGAVRYDGTVSDTVMRRAAVKSFQTDPGVRLFIANPAAAGAGLTLHSARLAIYESFSNQAAHYLQSLDRIHRRGQSRGVEYFMLLCDASIEIPEYERLIGKEQAAQSLLGDRAGPLTTRNELIAEARSIRLGRPNL